MLPIHYFKQFCSKYDFTNQLFHVQLSYCNYHSQSFLQSSRLVQKPFDTSLESCRRNNKDEKRKRNRDYARKFQSKTGGSRRKVVVEEKRAVVAGSEEKFQAQVFKHTTDDDMPAYTGFEFTA